MEIIHTADGVWAVGSSRIDNRWYFSVYKCDPTNDQIMSNISVYSSMLDKEGVGYFPHNVMLGGGESKALRAGIDFVKRGFKY